MRGDAARRIFPDVRAQRTTEAEGVFRSFFGQASKYPFFVVATVIARTDM